MQSAGAPLSALLLVVTERAAEAAARAHIAANAPEMARLANEWTQLADIIRDAIKEGWE